MSSYRNIRDLIAHLVTTDPLLYEALNRIDSQLSEPDIISETITQTIATSNTGWVKSGSNVRLDSPGDFVGVGTVAPTKRFSVVDLVTIDDAGRLLSNAIPQYTLSGGARHAAFHLDANGLAGDPLTAYGGEVNIPVSGNVIDLIWLTGTMGTAVHTSDTELSLIRFEGKNKGPNLFSVMRGIIGNVTMDGGGHVRTSYFRSTALAGSTGYLVSQLLAITPAASQAAGAAIDLMLHSTGAPNIAYAIQLTSDALKGWSAGIVFDDQFEAAIAAMRLRQAVGHGRIMWGGAGPYIESPSGNIIDLNSVLPPTILRLTGPSGSFMYDDQRSEEITLSTAGLTTDSAADLLPADSIIQSVLTRVTQTISGGGVTGFSVGDPTTLADRFVGNSPNLAAGSTVVGSRHWSTVLNAASVGPRQNNNAKIRITAVGGTPTQGKVRVTVFFKTFNPPTI